jgi:hypothetical protein
MRRRQTTSEPSETPLPGPIEALIAPPPPVRAQEEETEGAGTTTPSNEATPTAAKATPTPAYTATAASAAGTQWPQPLPADPPQHPILIDCRCHRVIDWFTMHILSIASDFVTSLVSLVESSQELSRLYKISTNRSGRLFSAVVERSTTCNCIARQEENAICRIPSRHVNNSVTVH